MIETQNLTKRYGETTAVSDLTFTAHRRPHLDRRSLDRDVRARTRR
jgi:hypothetical protein